MQFRRQSLNLNTILYQCRVIILLQQLLDVRLPVQDLPTELDIGNPSLVPVILQAPAADLQCLGKLPVGQELFPVEGRTVVTGKTFHFFLYIVQQGEEPADAPVFLIDNSFHFFRSLKVSVLSSFPHRLLLASDANVGHQLLHILGFVIELPLEAGERQPSSIAEGLQGTRRDVKAQADILAVQSLSGFLTAVSLIQSVHTCGQVLGARQHPLKDTGLDVAYFHIFNSFKCRSEYKGKKHERQARPAHWQE